MIDFGQDAVQDWLIGYLLSKQGLPVCRTPHQASPFRIDQFRYRQYLFPNRFVNEQSFSDTW
jgi:hypothetical protein